jgi:hypothetical protein
MCKWYFQVGGEGEWGEQRERRERMKRYGIEKE